MAQSPPPHAHPENARMPTQVVADAGSKYLVPPPPGEAVYRLSTLPGNPKHKGRSKLSIKGVSGSGRPRRNRA